MDGVLTDWIGAVFLLYGRVAPISATGRVEDALGVTEDALWERIETTPRFWELLHPTPFARILWGACMSLGQEVHVCTSPSYSPHSLAGKLRWLDAFFGAPFRNYIMTPQKHLFAGDGRVLIDDSERNCKNFGKRAILFPGPFNRRRDDTVHDVITDLRLLATT